MKKLLTKAIFLISVFFVFGAFIMLLLPILAPSFTFSYADLSSLVGKQSGELAFQKILYPYDSSGSSYSLEYFRYGALPGALFLLASIFSFSEAWVWSVLTLVSLVIGVYGFIKLFKNELLSVRGSLATSSILIFYFLNFYSLTRVIHIYIWFGYLVTPYLISLAFNYYNDKKLRHLVALAIVFSQFFVFPHGLIYGAILIALLSLYVASKSLLRGIKFLFAGALGYMVLNAQIFLSMLFTSTQYPIPSNITMFVLLSKNSSLQTTFSFTNIWWYLVEVTDVQNYKILGIIISYYIAILVLLLIVQNVYLKRWSQQFFIISMVSIFAIIIIISLGTHAEIIKSVLVYLSSKGMLDWVLPFREWARILILLPAFYLIVLVLAFKNYTEKNILGNAMRKFLPFIVALFLFYSGFLLKQLYKSYNPVIFPNIYQTMQYAIGQYDKVLWVSANKKIEKDGMPRLSWDSTKTPDLIEKSIGAQYGNPGGMQLPVKNYLLNELHSKKLLEDLLYNDIIVRNDIVANDLPKIITNGIETHASGEFLVRYPILEKHTNSRISESLYDGISDPRIWDILSSSDLHVIPVDKYSQNSYSLFQLGNEVNEAMIIMCAEEKSCESTSMYPYDQLDVHEPEKSWSKGTTAQLVHEPFVSYLQDMNSVTYQTDNNHGTSFTFGVGAKKEYQFSTLEKEGRYQLLVKILKGPASGNVDFTFTSMSKSIDTVSQLSHFEWVKLGEFDQQILSGMKFTVISNKGVNAIQEFRAIALNSGSNEIQSILENKKNIYVSYNEFDKLIKGHYRIICQNSNIYLSINNKPFDCQKSNSIVLNDVGSVEHGKGVILFLPETLLRIDSISYSLDRISPVVFTGKLPNNFAKDSIFQISELFDSSWIAIAEDSNGIKSTLKPILTYGFMQGYILDRDDYVKIEISNRTADKIALYRFLSLVLPLLVMLYWLILYVRKDGSDLKNRR